VHQQHPGFDVIGILHAVDGDGDLCHSLSSTEEQEVFLVQT
jgi:hypothetical protein